MRLSRGDFETLVMEAYQKLPPELLRSIENLGILVEDWPSRDQLEDLEADDPHGLFGLYSGVPLPERDGGQPPLPDTITLFQRPIENVCSARNEVIEEIRVTLLHEVGHYLGMSEDDLDRLGYG